MSERLNRVLEALDVGLQCPRPGTFAGWWERQPLVADDAPYDSPPPQQPRDPHASFYPCPEPDIGWEALTRWAESR